LFVSEGSSVFRIGLIAAANGAPMDLGIPPDADVVPIEELSTP